MYFLYISILILNTWTNNARFVKEQTQGHLKVHTKSDIPEYCKMETFFPVYAEQNITVSLDKLESMKKCSKYYPKCTSYPSELSAIFMENEEGKFYISVEIKVPNAKSCQDCWGYFIEINDGEESRQNFVKFNNQISIHQQKVYVRLGFNYQIAVTMLPTDRSLILETKAPSPCQLEILDNIYYKIKASDSCQNINEQPTYDERYALAEYVCSKHPNNMRKRKQIIKRLLKLNLGCKLILHKE